MTGAQEVRVRCCFCNLKEHRPTALQCADQSQSAYCWWPQSSGCAGKVLRVHSSQDSCVDQVSDSRVRERSSVRL